MENPMKVDDFGGYLETLGNPRVGYRLTAGKNHELHRITVPGRR